MTDSVRFAALLALRDVGVIRAGIAHPGYGALVLRGIAMAERPRTMPTGTCAVRDYRLTEHGRAVAAALKP